MMRDHIRTRLCQCKRDGEDQVTHARAESNQPYTLTAPVGSCNPVVLGASGACLLCELSAREINELIDRAPTKAWRVKNPKHLRAMIKQVKQQGSCQNIGIHPQGIETISASVRSVSEGIIAVVTIVGLNGDIDALGFDRAYDMVRQTAEACAAAMVG